MESHQHSTCVFCGHDRSHPLFEAPDVFGDTYELRDCEQCRSVFISPFPSDEKLARAYADDYYGEGDKKFTGFIEGILNWFRKGRARRLAKVLNGSGNVLDIGCGNGIFLDMLQSLGNFQINGLEMPGKSAERAKLVKNMHLKVGALTPDDYAEESFDAVTLYHVFEHLPDPKDYLSTIHRMLKKDGVLVMSFPNISSKQWRKFGPDWFHLDPPRHLFFMPRNGFVTEMKKLGFEVIKEQHFSIEYNPYGYQQSLLNRWVGKREVLYEHLKGNKEYTKEFSGSSIFWQSLFQKVTFPLFILADAFAALGHQSATVEFVLRKQEK